MAHITLPLEQNGSSLTVLQSQQRRLHKAFIRSELERRVSASDLAVHGLASSFLYLLLINCVNYNPGNEVGRCSVPEESGCARDYAGVVI